MTVSPGNRLVCEAACTIRKNKSGFATYYQIKLLLIFRKYRKGYFLHNKKASERITSWEVPVLFLQILPENSQLPASRTGITHRTFQRAKQNIPIFRMHCISSVVRRGADEGWQQYSRSPVADPAQRCLESWYFSGIRVSLRKCTGIWCIEVSRLDIHRQVVRQNWFFQHWHKSRTIKKHIENNVRNN